jgi:putative SbcD/Mre11-related phosphoesterase
MMKILLNERAVYLEDIDSVVIADLHIGYEDELRDRGIILPSQLENMRDRIKRIMEKTKAKRLIILGDIKHSIVKKPRKIVRFFEDIPWEIMAVKGNHDGGIEELVDFKVYPPQGLKIGKYGFIHGHSWPDIEVMNSEILFMGHIHPEVQLLDSMGKSHRMPCILMGSLTEEGVKRYGKNVKIVVLPAFNPLVGASLGKPLGPLFNNELIGNLDVYLLNGTYLGKYNNFQSLNSDEQ